MINRIEMLLFLSCAVGFVAFMCFGLAISNALSAMPASDHAAETAPSIAGNAGALRARLEALERERTRLTAEWERLATGSTDTAAGAREDEAGLQRQAAALREEARHVQENIDALTRDLGGLTAATQPGSKADKERQLEALQKQLQEIKTRVRAAEDRISGRRRSAEESQQAVPRLRQKLDDLKNQEQQVRKTMNDYQARAIMAGHDVFRDPLYVECKAGGYTAYPGSRALTQKEVEGGEALGSMVAGHDVILILVRPDGFDSYDMLSDRIENLDTVKSGRVKVSYEPVKQELDLSFLNAKGKRP